MSTKLICIAKIILFGVLLSAVVSTSFAKPPKDATDNTAKTDTNVDAEFPEEDSDMLMEPNDFSPITVLRSQEHQFHSLPQHGNFQPIPNPTQLTARRDAIVIDSHSQAAQNFYPPFYRDAPPLGHSRPYFPTPDSPAIPKYAVPLPKVDGTVAGVSQGTAATGTPRNFDTALLGSGDFGVIRGGTFYPEEEMPYHPEDNSDFSDYYADANNGHGRPANDGFIQKYTYPEEQFAQFRDFADINTPADGAFSQFVVVYAAKNSTAANTHPHPKNIFEQLELLDREKALETKKLRPTSKSKAKLAKTKLQKKYKKDTNPKDFDLEPLLALS